MEDPTKVKVRLKDGGGGPTAQRRHELTNLLRLYDITVLRLIDQRDGWVIATQSTNEVNQLVSSKHVKEDLQNLGLEVVTPNNIKCKYQLVIKKVDYSILEYSEDQIKQEMTRNEPIMTDQIEEIFLMYEHNIIKLKLKSLTVANKIKENGVKLFGFKCRYIENERNNRIQQCMLCYQYDHQASACQAKTIICSECSSTGHTWKDCNPMNKKKCTQCHEEHRTFSNKCKIRKQKILEEENIRKKKEEENQQKIKPIAEALKTNNKVTEISFANVVRRNIEEATTVTGAMIKENNKETSKNIQAMVKEAVKEEMKELYANIIELIRGTISQEVAYYTTAIREGQEELKKEINSLKTLRTVVKRKADENETMTRRIETDTEGEKTHPAIRKPRLKKKPEKKQATPRRLNTGQLKAMLTSGDIVKSSTNLKKSKEPAKETETEDMEAQENTQDEGTTTEGKETNKKPQNKGKAVKALNYAEIDTDHVMRQLSSTTSSDSDSFGEHEIEHEPIKIVSSEPSPDSVPNSQQLSPLMPMPEISTPTPIAIITEQIEQLSMKKKMEELIAEMETLKEYKERKEKEEQEAKAEETRIRNKKEEKRKIERSVLERIKQVGIEQVHLETYEEKGRIRGEQYGIDYEQESEELNEFNRKFEIFNTKFEFVLDEINRSNNHRLEECKMLPPAEGMKKWEEYSKELKTRDQEARRLEGVNFIEAKKEALGEQTSQEEENFSC